LERITNAWLGTIATNALILACNVCTGVLLARLLLPEGRGLLATIMFWPGLISSVGLMSLDQAVAHRVARASTESRRTGATATCLALALCCLVAPALVVALPYLLGEDRREWWLTAQIYALAFIPVTYLGSIVRALDYGELRLIRYNSWRIIPPFVYLAGLSLMGVMDSASVRFALWSSWLGVVAMALIPMAYRVSALAHRPSRAEVRPLIRLALPFHGTNLALLFGSHIDRLLLVLMFEDSEIGLYLIAVTWAATSLSAVYGSFCNVLFPYLSAEADPERQRLLLAAGLRYACPVLVGAVAALACVTSWLLPALFGADFQHSIPIAYALMAAYLPLSFRRIIVYGLRGLGKAHPGTVAEVVTIVIFMVSAWPSTRALGLIGVPAALVLANLLSLLYLVGYLQRQLGLRPADWWGLTPATLNELVLVAARYVGRWRIARRSR
jgi:O-antigen/teichoic acid export membrane protein